MRVSSIRKSLGWSVAIALLAVVAGAAIASTDQLVNTGVGKVNDGKAAQGTVDRIVDGAQKRLLEYRSLLKQVDGLKAYNEQLQTQVQAQRNLIVRFDKSIEEVAEIERLIVPEISTMAAEMETFVAEDLPFHWKERAERIGYLKETMASAKINVAEKFRHVLEVAQIENEYARNIDSYSENITVDGAPVEVDVLVIGRVALLAQTKDTKNTYRYDNTSDTWSAVDTGTYRNSIRKGIKMAQKQAPIDVLTIPVAQSEE